ncbi:MAG: alginate lyase family protein [Armatimonadota bacterium]
MVAVITVIVALMTAVSGAPAETLLSEKGPLLPPVDEEISDREILQIVDPDYPGLQEFSEALQAGDIPRARRLLARHFATRERPYIPPPTHPAVPKKNTRQPPRRNSMMILLASGDDKQLADEKWMKHIFTNRNYDTGEMETYEFGPTVKWQENPSEFKGWMTWLNQLNILAMLAGVYHDTGEDKYAAEVGDLMVSWTEQCARNIGGRLQDGQPVWRANPIEVRNRTCNVLVAYDVVRKSPALTPDMHMAFWKLFVGSSRYLVKMSEGNEEYITYPALVPAGVFLPEFTEAPRWIEAGEENIRKILVDRTTPDGAWDTYSVNYQMVPLPLAFRVLEIVEANSEVGAGAELAQLVRNQSRKMLEIMMWLAMPNMGTPCIGDIYGRCDWDPGYLYGRLKWYLATYVPEQQRREIEQIPDPFERLRATLAYSAGDGEDTPSTTSLGFPSTGYFVMRRSWEPRKSPYMYFDLSPQARAHAHLDAGHFELYAYGKPLLVDTGDYQLGYGDRTALHNTIEIDEKQQERFCEIMPGEWITEEGFDFVTGAHAGYESLGVTHRRDMLFLKDTQGDCADYWILSDLVTGEGSHKCEQFFHFAGPVQWKPAEAEIHPDTKAVTTCNSTTANVSVVPAPDENLQVGFVEAQDTEMKPEDRTERKAMLGWLVTDGTFQRVKSPVAVYTREGALPVAYHEVLFPTPKNAVADIHVERLQVVENGRTLQPHRAAGLRIEVRLDEPTITGEEISIHTGQNFGAMLDGFAGVNTGSIPADCPKLTDGEIGPYDPGAAVSSQPYQQDASLEGHFGIDFGGRVEINAVTAYHGSWNGMELIYPAQTMTAQYRDGEKWCDVGNPRTIQSGEGASTVLFDTVRTSRVRVIVRRPRGGRIAMRELEAYNIADEEVRRVERLLQQRTVRQWTDYVLISHDAAERRRYGHFLFDGELAVVRKDSEGGTVRVLMKHGSSLKERDRLLAGSDNRMDIVHAAWDGDTVRIRSRAAPDIRVLAGEARTMIMNGAQVQATLDGAILQSAGPSAKDAPTIGNLQVELHPPQAGLSGGQRYAIVTWTTDRPSTSRVEFTADGAPVRRSFFRSDRTTQHRVRVDFLRKDREYRFTAISVDERGRRAEQRADNVVEKTNVR